MKYRKILFTLSAVSVLLLTACEKYENPKTVEINITTTLENIDIHSELQNELINSDNPDIWVYQYASKTQQKATESNSFPNSFDIEYNITSNNNVKPRKVYVDVSAFSDMDSYMRFEGDEHKATVNNLKINQKYYYRVVAHYVSDFTSEPKSFTVTTSKIRNIFVEGVENCRDLGGWDIGDDRIYKQGLIYRTAQFNYGGSNNTYVSAPSKNGLKTLKNDLKIKTEIDLRQVKIPDVSVDEVNGITSSPLGKDVNYVSAPMKYGGEDIFEVQYNKESLKLFFETLAVEDNYPIAFHCLRGTDRTGGLAYVLGALVGMSKEDLMLDYLFSNLAAIGNVVRVSSINSKYVLGIEQASGDTYSEKAKNYLMSKVDISENTINAIIRILTAVIPQ